MLSYLDFLLIPWAKPRCSGRDPLADQPPTPLPRISENRSRSTAQWISSHVRPERRYLPPGGTGLRRGALCSVWKSPAGRYSQLLSGHAAIGPFLHDPYDWTPETGHGQVLVVQLREVADAPSPLHGEPNVGLSDQEPVEEDWQGLPVAAPEGAVGW